MSETIETATQGDETAHQPETETAPAPGTEQSPEPTEAEKPKPPALDPKDRAIRQAAFEAREAKREAQALRTELARVQPPRDPNAPLNPAEIERMVEQKAREIIEQREQQAATDAWVAKGNAEFPDFNERCQLLADMGAAQNPAFMAIASKIRDGHKALAELGANPAEAARVLSLDPVSMAIEMAGLAHKAAAAPPAPPKPTTKAPEPITPIAATAKAEPDPSKMSTDEFQKWWNKRTRG